MPIKPVIINPEDAPWDYWGIDLRYWKEKREMDKEGKYSLVWKKYSTDELIIKHNRIKSRLKKEPDTYGQIPKIIDLFESLEAELEERDGYN